MSNLPLISPFHITYLLISIVTSYQVNFTVQVLYGWQQQMAVNKCARQHISQMLVEYVSSECWLSIRLDDPWVDMCMRVKEYFWMVSGGCPGQYIFSNPTNLIYPGSLMVPWLSTFYISPQLSLQLLSSIIGTSGQMCSCIGSMVLTMLRGSRSVSREEQGECSHRTAVNMSC